MFRPGLALTLLLFLLASLFCALGYWQLQRKAEKETLFNQFETAPVMGIGQALDQERRFARVEGWGHFDTGRHVLLDNRMFNGRAGVHVLTPFMLGDGRTVLVNRGWLPMPPDRSRLPDVPTDGTARTIRGRLNTLESSGPRLGEADRPVSDRWPQLVTWLDREPLERALETELPPWIVQLDSDQEDGFGDRQWNAAVMPPETHGAYAVQWFALAVAALIIWITLGYRNAERGKQETRA